jgi:hypothetical protein
MNRIPLTIFFLVVVAISVRSFTAPVKHQAKLIRALIFSGSNNHDWKKTPPLLNRIFDEATLFSTQVMDEIWEKTELYDGAKAIGSLKASNAKDGHPIDEPAIWVNQTGKGRSFFTIPGHDERALLNSGMRTLLIRAAQWCARKEVTFNPPVEMSLNQNQGKPLYSWMESDTTNLDKREVL